MTNSLGVAEMAKMMENVKRDVNIALMNEFVRICNKLNIDFYEVLNLARTKCNFDTSSYEPGIVGGHCISVDPYYLIDLMQNDDYYVSLIKQARNENEAMTRFIVKDIKKLVNKKNAKITIIGFAFKENCNDIRNTKVYDLFKKLDEADWVKQVEIFDTVCDEKSVQQQYGILLSETMPQDNDCIIVAVANEEYLNIDFKRSLNEKGIVYDVKNVFGKLSWEDKVNRISSNYVEFKDNVPYDKVYNLSGKFQKE